MARDYRPADTRPDSGNGGRSGGKTRGMNPLFIGIIIGLLLGIGLALVFAIWLNRANNPFIEKSRPVEALPTIAARSSTAASPSLPPVTPAAARGEAEKPRFEFYQILPGEKREKGGKPEAAMAFKAADPAAKTASEAKPIHKFDAKPDVKPDSGEVLFLQAGAFQSPTDAENMKAKIAFAGFEAMVRPVNLPDRGTLYRVRLGPYKSLDEVNRIKTTLSQGGIGAAVVKGSDY